MAGPKIRKSALVTGCSEGGIGDGLALELHRRGLRVFATARNLSKVQHLKELGLELIQLDVTDPQSISEAMEKVKETTGGSLDILINNSGSGYQTPLLDADIETVKAMFDVNVFGLLRTTQIFFPLIRNAGGTVVNIGSISAYTSVPFVGMYGVSKASLQHLSDILRQELAPFKVKVVHVVAGGVSTNFWDNASGTKLATDSIYQPIQEKAEFQMRGGKLENANMPREKFCSGVVSNILSSHPSPWHWCGGRTLLSRVGAIVSISFWHTAWDVLTWREYGMRDLARYVKANDSPV